jgi:hypothetical protein
MLALEGPLITRRQFLRGLSAFSVGAAGFGGFALAEPFRLNVTRYQIAPRGWPHGLRLRLAVLADIHACEPWMGVDRIRQVVARTNALSPDAVLLLGDFVAGKHLSRIGRPIDDASWASLLGAIKAPLGIHAVLGNHDWWQDRELLRAPRGPGRVRRALEANGIAVYENDAVRLVKNGQPFWIAGLGDQWAFWPQMRRSGKRPSQIDNMGVDDLPATMARISDGHPVILMAHEPEIFPKVPARVTLTLSGHTHGGQVRLFGYSPVVPSRYGQRFAYGHVIERAGTPASAAEKHLVVSGGLGVSGVPLRFGVPPEIVVVELGGSAISGRHSATL